MHVLNYKEDYAYLNSRLRDSVVKLNGKPIYIHVVKASGLVHYNDYEDMNKEKDCMADDLDLSHFRLGYANSKYGETSFVSRMPNRQWRQGLTYSNCLYHGKGGVQFMDKSFLKMLNKKYPKLDYAYELVSNGDCGTVAITPEFALKGKNATLQFRGVDVGKTMFAGEGYVNLILNDKHQFLQEVLEGNLNETHH